RSTPTTMRRASAWSMYSGGAVNGEGSRMNWPRAGPGGRGAKVVIGEGNWRSYARSEGALAQIISAGFPTLHTFIQPHHKQPKEMTTTTASTGAANTMISKMLIRGASQAVPSQPHVGRCREGNKPSTNTIRVPPLNGNTDRP